MVAIVFLLNVLIATTFGNLIGHRRHAGVAWVFCMPPAMGLNRWDVLRFVVRSPVALPARRTIDSNSACTNCQPQGLWSDVRISGPMALKTSSVPTCPAWPTTRRFVACVFMSVSEHDCNIYIYIDCDRLDLHKHMYIYIYIHIYAYCETTS